MIKIFIYELKRQLTSILFLSMLAVNAIFAWYILTTEIIVGVAYTAPFSLWSHCAYIGKTLPVAIIIILLLQAGYYGKQQKKVEILTSSTPITYTQSIVIRTTVLSVCFLIIYFVNGLLEAIFFMTLFDYSDFGILILPALFEIVPCFVFTMGFGHLAGRLHCGFIYALLPVVFIAGYLGGTGAFDLFGNGFFSTFPLTLPIGINGEPDFQINLMWLIARLVYLMMGAGMIVLNISTQTKTKRA